MAKDVRFAGHLWSVRVEDGGRYRNGDSADD